ncbi:MAG: hypothetical protein IKT52_00415 [Oscillospiraceae bacterium]|nr:hypothetical protein [Oscillospiraceae bacterium]
MVVNEKGLLRAMKDAYKGLGYKVAAKDTGGQLDIIIAAKYWTVVIENSCLPRKVRALITEHLNDNLNPGDAFQIKEKETQTELLETVLLDIQNFHSGEKERRIVRKTVLTLGGYSLWQSVTDQKVIKLDPDNEDVMAWDSKVVRLIGDNLLLLDDTNSRAYVTCMKSETVESNMLAHLSAVQWPVT